MTPSIVWFKTDLRTQDNPALWEASKNGPCVGVYVLDHKELEPVSPELNWARSGPHRRAFLRESLVNLRENIRKLGSELIVAWGKPEEILPEILREIQGKTIYCAQEVCPEERATLAKVRKALPEGMELKITGANRVFAPIENTPDVFSPFSRQLRGNPALHALAPLTTIEPPTGVRQSEIPQLRSLANSPANKISGGENPGEARADYYLESGKYIFTYAKTRNRLEGETFSTKFSPWLAHGCLSARALYHRAISLGEKTGKSYEVQKFLDEMTWREFFWHVAKKHGTNFFLEQGIQSRPFQKKPLNAEKFNSWRLGQTQDPLINAIMRELLHTGFTSNRARQVSASYLIHNLGQPWTAGAWWFQHALIDYDPTQNWGNWLHASGRGTDPVPDRKFNPYLQAQKFDPDGAFQKRWQ